MVVYGRSLRAGYPLMHVGDYTVREQILRDALDDKGYLAYLDLGR